MDNELKTCCRCKKELPKTLEYFGKDKQAKDGFNHACRECLGGHYTKQVKDGYKLCNKCGREFPATLEYFNKRKEIPSGLSSSCKECKRNYSKRYRKENTEKVSEYHKRHYEETKDMNREKSIAWTKAWRAKNQEKVKEYKKQYKEVNRDSILEYSKKYHAEHREENKARCKEYNQANKDYIANQRKEHYKTHKEEINERSRAWSKKNIDRVIERNQRRRAMEANLEHSFTKSEWAECKKFFNHCCAYCGKPSKKLQQDHFVALSKGGGYVKSNILPACKSCNCSKNNKDFFDWYPKQDFYSREREIKLLEYLNIEDSRDYMEVSR